MPREEPLFTDGLLEPPVRRYTGPIIDVHTHVGDPGQARLLFETAADFGVRVVCGIARLDEFDALEAAYGEAFRPVIWIDHTHVGRPARFARDNIRTLRQARRRGAVAAKFWYTPRFIGETGFWFDDPALRPIFEVLSELAMPAMVHLGDPDCWFQTHYADTARYGVKADYTAALEHTLADFPALKVLGAHFGADPEHLGDLGRRLDAYPNYCIDTSATKWVSRELSVKPDESRDFAVAYADRILFGSDLVVFADGTPAYYGSRYWVQRWLWEGEGERPSPIPDPCAPWPDGPKVVGLALPDDALPRLYCDNARRFLGIDVPSA